MTDLRTIALLAMSASPASASLVEAFEGYGFRQVSDCTETYRRAKWPGDHYLVDAPRIVCTDVIWQGDKLARLDQYADPYIPVEAVILWPALSELHAPSGRAGTPHRAANLMPAPTPGQPPLWGVMPRTTPEPPTTPIPLPGAFGMLMMAFALLMTAVKRKRA